MQAFNVWCNGRKIDTVFSSDTGTIAERCEAVRRSLINHDGYPSDIRVTWPRGQRVTRTYWELQGNSTASSGIPQIGFATWED